MSEFQSYNKKSKKWVLFKNGKISKMQAGKFKGVPEKGGTKKPGTPKKKLKSGSRKSKAKASLKTNRFCLWCG